jgi:hypothetical protein
MPFDGYSYHEPAPRLTDAQRIAYRAIALLQNQGWTQGVMCHPLTGRHCIMGAIIESTHRYTDLIGKVFVVAEGMLGTSIAVWNDDPERTFEEVIAFMERLAVELRTVSQQVDYYAAILAADIHKTFSGLFVETQPNEIKVYSTV